MEQQNIFNLVYSSLQATLDQVKEPGKNGLVIPLEEYARNLNMGAGTLRKCIIRLHDEGRIIARKMSYPIYIPEAWEVSFKQAMTLDDLLTLKNQFHGKPRKVVHCGSTNRAREAFEEWRLRDTLSGYIVLTIGAAKNDKDLGITSEQAVSLDILHLFKIEEADIVRVLNVGGYIGESTQREIEYARRLGKPIMYIEQP
jgi:hypothetical protein